MKVPGLKMAPDQVSLVRTIEIHRKIFKILRLQNHLAKMLEIRYVALPSSFYQVCSNVGPSVQDGPAPGGPRFKT